MIFPATKFAVVLQGNRLVAAAVRGDRVETFVVEAEQPATALRAELDARKLKPRKTAVGLSRTSVTVKPIDLPPIDGAVRDMVQFELERHLPFPAEDAPFDFIPLGGGKDARPPATEGRRVLVVAAERRLVEAALKIVDEARLRPVSVTVASHDLLGLVRIDRKARVAWVHRTARTAELLFVAGGTLVLSRAVPVAEEPVIAEEIRRSLAMLRWKTCDAIWVSGEINAADVAGGGGLAAVAARVSEPPYTRRARRWLEANQQGLGGAAELAIAVATGRRTRPLDLIPQTRRPRRVSRGQMVTAATLAATVVLGVVALMLPGYRTSRYLEAVNVEIARLAPQVRETERVLQELEKRKRLLGTIEAAQNASVSPLPVLRDLTDLIPADAWVTNLTLDAKGVELAGQATTASALIPILENSPRLERVEFSSPVTRARDKEQFRIRAAWEGGPGRATAPTMAAVVPDGATPRSPSPAPGAPGVTPAPGPISGSPGLAPAPAGTTPGPSPPAVTRAAPPRPLPPADEDEDEEGNSISPLRRMIVPGGRSPAPPPGATR